MLKNTLTGAVLFAVAACATSAERPRGVDVALSSGTTRTPYTQKELTNPAIQKVVEECRRKLGKTRTGAIEKCTSRIAPSDDRTQFDRTVDDAVWTLVTLTGLQAGRTYEVKWILVDPDGNRRSFLSIPIEVPSEWKINYDLKYTFDWTPPDHASWQLGRWKVDIFANGKREIERFFTVIAS